jgi:hypothetical protein
VRATRPWATASYVADLVLRLSLGREYLTRRGVGDPAAAVALQREGDDLRSGLEASP